MNMDVSRLGHVEPVKRSEANVTVGQTFSCLPPDFITTLLQTSLDFTDMAMDGLDDFEQQLDRRKSERSHDDHKKYKYHHTTTTNTETRIAIDIDINTIMIITIDISNNDSRAMGMRRGDQNTAIRITTATATRATDTSGEAQTSWLFVFPKVQKVDYYTISA